MYIVSTSFLFCTIQNHTKEPARFSKFYFNLVWNEHFFLPYFSNIFEIFFPIKTARGTFVLPDATASVAIPFVQGHTSC